MFLFEFLLIWLSGLFVSCGFSFNGLQMYVTPPDTDVYAIPKVLAPMPQKVLQFLLFLVQLQLLRSL